MKYFNTTFPLFNFFLGAHLRDALARTTVNVNVPWFHTTSTERRGGTISRKNAYGEHKQNRRL